MTYETPAEQLRRVIAEGKRINSPAGRLYPHLARPAQVARGTTVQAARRPTQQTKPSLARRMYPGLKSEGD